MRSDVYKYESNIFNDEWGFYVDIEKLPSQDNMLNHEIMREKYKIKNINKFNKYDCETICEEYEYYCKNNIEEKIDGLDVSNYESKENNIKSLIVKVSSTTFITVIITYYILVVL